jgi:hypothetical protein
MTMMTKNKSFVLLDALLVDPSYTLKPHKGGIKTHNDKNRKRWQHTYAWQKERDEIKFT